MEWETDEREGTVNVRDNVETTAGTSAQDAVDKALAEFEGTVKDVEYNEDDGLYYYEIEIENGNEGFEVKLNANDITVLEEEHESDNNERSFKKLEAAHQEKVITLEGAVSATKQAVNGDTVEWQYDVDDFKYEFEIGDSEVEINSKTGEVTEIDD